MPKSITIRAPAKINLCLDILKRTSSGYHKIQTVLQEIPEIFDEIRIETTKNSDKLSITHSPKFQPQNSPVHTNRDASAGLHEPVQDMKHTKSQAILYDQNLAYQALQLIRATYAKSSKKFVHITIKKNIPVSSGLGGASSDAAAVLKGLNSFWNLEIPTKKLLALAAKLGMDVPFFILGGTALGTNFGEKITPLPPLKNFKFKIFAKSANSQNFFNKQRNRSSTKSARLPGFRRGADFLCQKTVSDSHSAFCETAPKTRHASQISQSKTALAYASLDLSLCGKNTAKTKALSEKKHKQGHISKSRLQSLLHNDFETLPAYKNLPQNHHLSGSGPTTFSL